MNNNLYLVALVTFWAQGALIEAPAQVLFPRNQAAREYWDRISRAGELRFKHVRDMAIASCSELPAWVKLRTPPRLNRFGGNLIWAPDGKLALISTDLSAGPRLAFSDITVWNNSLNQVEKVIDLGLLGSGIRKSMESDRE